MSQRTPFHAVPELQSLEVVEKEQQHYRSPSPFGQRSVSVYQTPTIQRLLTTVKVVK